MSYGNSMGGVTAAQCMQWQALAGFQADQRMYSAHMGGASMYGLQGMPMFGGVGGMLASGPSSAPMLSVPLAVPAAHSHPSAFDFASPPQPQARAMQVSSLLSDGPTIEYNAAALPTFPPSSATPAMHTAQRSPSAHSNSSVPPTWESVRAAVAPAIAPTKAVLAAVSASPLVKSECSRKSSKSGGSKGSSKRQPSVHSLQLQNAALQSQLNENLKRINMVHDLVQRISTEGSHPSPSVGDSEVPPEPLIPLLAPPPVQTVCTLPTLAPVLARQTVMHRGALARFEQHRPPCARCLSAQAPRVPPPHPTPPHPTLVSRSLPPDADATSRDLPQAEAECPEQPEEQVHEAQSRYWNDEVTAFPPGPLGACACRSCHDAVGILWDECREFSPALGAGTLGAGTLGGSGALFCTAQSSVDAFRIPYTSIVTPSAA